MAFVPSRLAPGWRYESWTSTGKKLAIVFRNPAGKEVDFLVSRLRGDCRAGKQKFFQMAGVKTYWSLTGGRQQAWRCVSGMKLTAATSLAPDRFADVGLARLAASGHRILG
ncbi:MAG: hypothetical protein QOF43_1104 [Gaiellaceae bacterium]|nr:hypothetical protein [Gaiellaceae bacterium]